MTPTPTPWSGRVDECREQFSSERNEAIRQEIVEHVESTPVVDVGCGTGELKEHIGGEYIGVDLTPEFDPDIVGDATDLPFGDNHVPTVVVKNTLQHIPDWRAAVAECCRVAADRVVVVERTHELPTEIVAEEPCLRRRFQPVDLVTAVGDYTRPTGTATLHDCETDDRLSIVVGNIR